MCDYLYVKFFETLDSFIADAGETLGVVKSIVDGKEEYTFALKSFTEKGLLAISTDYIVRLNVENGYTKIRDKEIADLRIKLYIDEKHKRIYVKDSADILGGSTIAEEYKVIRYDPRKDFLEAFKNGIIKIIESDKEKYIAECKAERKSRYLYDECRIVKSDLVKFIKEQKGFAPREQGDNIEFQYEEEFSSLDQLTTYLDDEEALNNAIRKCFETTKYSYVSKYIYIEEFNKELEKLASEKRKMFEQYFDLEELIKVNCPAAKTLTAKIGYGKIKVGPHIFVDEKNIQLRDASSWRYYDFKEVKEITYGRKVLYKKY